MLIKGLSIQFIEKQIKHNITSRARSIKDIKAIVIHYTANNSPSADAQNHFNYWNTAVRNSSCDIVVDDHSIWKINDWFKYYTWQIGDGKGKYGYYNKDVIGIEMCVNDGGNLPKTIKNTIELIRALHKMGYTKNVIRHYDASRKLCPAFFIDLNIKGYNAAYSDFRKKVFAVEEPKAKVPYADSEILKYGYDRKWYIGTNYKEDDPVTWKKLIWVLRNYEEYLKEQKQK